MIFFAHGVAHFVSVASPSVYFRNNPMKYFFCIKRLPTHEKKIFMIFKNVVALVLAVMMLTTAVCYAEIYNSEPSNRVEINLGATPWQFVRSDPVGAQAIGFNDAAWKTVGIPHTWNDTDTYLNEPAGG